MGQVIETILWQDKILAIILRADYKATGIEFFTPDGFSQQLAYMNRPQGYVIDPHLHNPVMREIQFTHEVLFIRSGRLRVDFYNDIQVYLESRIINTGDVVLLASGGHGFEVLSESEIIEVKQGPYAGDKDKTKFLPISKDKIIIN